MPILPRPGPLSHKSHNSPAPSPKRAQPPRKSSISSLPSLLPKPALSACWNSIGGIGALRIVPIMCAMSRIAGGSLSLADRQCSTNYGRLAQSRHHPDPSLRFFSNPGHQTPFRLLSPPSSGLAWLSQRRSAIIHKPCVGHRLLVARRVTSVLPSIFLSRSIKQVSILMYAFSRIVVARRPVRQPHKPGNYEACAEALGQF